MGRKKDQEFPLNNDSGNDFSEEDHILHYKPKIEWVEPPEEFLEEFPDVEIKEEVAENRRRTEDLISGYSRVKELTDMVKKRVDARIEAAGGFEIPLDPIVDAQVVGAIKRRFPKEKGDKLTFDMYKKALDCLSKQAKPAPAVTIDDIRRAKSNPTTTDFGGLGAKPGQLRPEISSSANFMKPVDLNKYQKNAILALFKMLYPLVSGDTDAKIKKHEMTKVHGS